MYRGPSGLAFTYHRYAYNGYIYPSKIPDQRRSIHSLRNMVEHLKSWIRTILARVLYNLFYRYAKSWDVSRDGHPLKNGITAVVCAKNEAYLISFCLKSLIGVVDQVICIDNGSSDGTLEEMQRFNEEHNADLEVTVLSLPGKTLGECRNAGLDNSRYKWHLRWDADMLCRTSGENDMRKLRNKVLSNDRPRTIQLPRLNLRGDFKYTRAEGAADPGEPILVRFGRHIIYREFGRFDAISTPFYYSMISEKKHYYVHCEGIKPDDNLIYRYQYFDWREQYNKYNDNNRPESVQTFENFVKHGWTGFGTTDHRAIKWRFQRLYCSTMKPLLNGELGGYPDVLADELLKENPRFNVILKDSMPYTRLDFEDPEMHDYVPTEDDYAWETENEKILKRHHGR
ncbi:MAG: glycosyltransferase [Flavobacteriales bacterium]|nr:glycosyltransferase [Flavobacteriales bacterium]